MVVPILQLLTNIDTILNEENPLSLKYMMYGVHDLQIINLLTLLGYYLMDPENFWSQNTLKPPSYNASIRFEVLQRVLFTEHDPDEISKPLVRVIFDDVELPLDFCSSSEIRALTLCDLKDFIDKVYGMLRYKNLEDRKVLCQKSLSDLQETD